MKNLHKLALCLLVGIMAIGFSAFKNAEKTKAVAVVYYHLPDDSYSTTQPTGSGISCKPILSDPCTVTYASAQSQQSYANFAALPSGGTASGAKGDWE